ncbi:MAG: hypothetical protein ACT4NU_10200 [Chromatiales bacterium]
MKTDVSTAKQVLGAAFGCLMLAPLGALAAGPIGSTLQTEASAGTAAAGNADSALISVLITKTNGLPAPNFGDGVDLENEIFIVTGFNQPDLGSGCVLKAQNYTNHLNGVYTVEVVPMLDPGPGSCNWLAGEYHYVVKINSVIPSVGRFRGSTLGTLDIP